MLVSGGSIYVGDSAITAVYQGEDLIWPLEPTPTGSSVYYRTEYKRSVEEIVENFDDIKRSVLFPTETGFTFAVTILLEGYITAFAIPSTKTVTSITKEESVTGVVTDCTSDFLVNTPEDLIVNGIPYKLYYSYTAWAHVYAIKVYLR